MRMNLYFEKKEKRNKMNKSVRRKSRIRYKLKKKIPQGIDYLFLNLIIIYMLKLLMMEKARLLQVLLV